MGGGGGWGGERWRGDEGGADQIGLLSQSGTDLRLGVAPSAMSPAAALAGGGLGAGTLQMGQVGERWRWRPRSLSRGIEPDRRRVTGGLD